RLEEVFFNRLVHPLTIPDMGLRSLRLRERFDVVHVHAHPARIGGLGRIPLVMSEGSSSAVYIRDYLNWGEDRLARAYARTRRIYRALGIHDRLLNLDRVARAYVFSRWARDVNIRWGADPEKIDVVYPGFPTPPPVERSRRETFTFLFVGTDFERKGGFEVVEAFGAVAAERREARLLIVSSDPGMPNPDRVHHSWVTESKRQAGLMRLGALERQGLVERHPLLGQERLFEEMYPRADAFVMPSHAEGFGFTNVEALSFGLPVISSRVGAIPEVVEHERSGLLVAAGDVGTLAEAMLRLASERSLAVRMGEAARAAFLERFTLERFRAEVGRVYRDAMEGRCGAS
ncbi:MAG TPA: glycosyltransferase family 4 protein, partial [Vicinamibacteria bacterium]|nr:glycosyltransferase family 4 protein [Vicinamibacteria bacterium]